MKSEFIINIQLVGDKNVGLTTFIKTFFSESPNKSDTNIKKVDLDGFHYKFVVWDLKNIKEIPNLDDQGLAGVIGVYDVNRRSTFETLKRIIDEYINLNLRVLKPIIIVGNKTDLQLKKSNSTTDKVAIEYCSKLSEQTKEKGFIVKHFYISAINENDVSNIMLNLAKTYINFLKWNYFPEGKKISLDN